MSVAVMPTSTLEISRRALIADLGATLDEQQEFRSHAELVSTDMPARLAWAIQREGWIVEPAVCDLALRLARRYGQGARRRRIVAVFLREAAAALRFAPPEFRDPHDWAQVALMNVGSIAYTAEGQGAGARRRPSVSALNSRDRGCQAIARRGACRCIVCGAPVHQAPVGGAVVERFHHPLTCSSWCGESERYYTDAMARVFDRCEWLLAEAMTLRVEMLASPRV